jgi:hypothetical protein
MRASGAAWKRQKFACGTAIDLDQDVRASARFATRNSIASKAASVGKLYYFNPAQFISTWFYLAVTYEDRPLKRTDLGDYQCRHSLQKSASPIATPWQDEKNALNFQRIQRVLVKQLTNTLSTLFSRTCERLAWIVLKSHPCPKPRKESPLYPRFPRSLLSR